MCAKLFVVEGTPRYATDATTHQELKLSECQQASCFDRLTTEIKPCVQTQVVSPVLWQQIPAWRVCNAACEAGGLDAD